MTDMVVIPGLGGKYAITSDGSVWSYPKPLSGCLEGKGMTKGKWLSKVSSGNYLVVRLGEGKQELIHRLVALTYLKKPIGKDHVNHKNGITTDNRVSNLEWCTQAENNRHAWATGLVKPKKALTAQDAISIREQYSLGNVSHSQLATKFNVGRTTIQRAIAGVGY